LLEPTTTELAAKEAALRASILGTQAYPFGADAPSLTTGYGGPVNIAEPTLSMTPSSPEILGVDLATGRLETSEGSFLLNSDETQVFVVASIFALKRNFEDILLKLVTTHKIDPKILFPQAPDDAAPAPAVPPVAAIPVPTAPVVEDDEEDPPSPDPKPTRRPRK